MFVVLVAIGIAALGWLGLLLFSVFRRRSGERQSGERRSALRRINASLFAVPGIFVLLDGLADHGHDFSGWFLWFAFGCFALAMWELWSSPVKKGVQP